MVDNKQEVNKDKDYKGILAVFNSLEPFETNGGDECYVLVKYTPELIEEFEAVGVTKEELDKYVEGDTLDLVYLGLYEKYFNYYDGKQFIKYDKMVTINEVNADINSVSFYSVDKSLHLLVENKEGLTNVPVTTEDIAKLLEVLETTK